MDITIHRDGTNYGPFTLDQVNEHLASGSLLPTDLGWYEGCQDWSPLNDVVATLSSVPPLIPQIPPVLALESQPTDATAEIENKATRSDSRTFYATFFLCLFLGMFGAHRFYLGKKNAWLQLVSLGGCGIWAWIDLISSG